MCVRSLRLRAPNGHVCARQSLGLCVHTVNHVCAQAQGLARTEWHCLITPKLVAVGVQ